MSEPFEELPEPQSDFDGLDDPNCFWCGGERWDECDEPIECTSAHRVIYNADGSFGGQLCRCASCGGSGLAKDMRIW